MRRFREAQSSKAEAAEATAPATTPLTVPVSVNVFGTTSALLGTPDKWATMVVDGVTYKVGLYL